MKRKRYCEDCKEETSHYHEPNVGEDLQDESVWVCDECGKETPAI